MYRKGRMVYGTAMDGVTLDGLAFLDLETTGLDPDRHAVWELGVAFGSGPAESRVVPHVLSGANAAALRVGRYRERAGGRDRLSDLEALEWEQRVEVRFADERPVLVGANPAFDAAFLARRWGVVGRAPWEYRLVDVEAVAMGRLRWDRPRGLREVCRALDVAEPDHTAGGDVEAVRDCYVRLMWSE